MVSPCFELSDVGEVQILGDEEPTGRLYRRPNDLIRSACQPFGRRRISIMSKPAKDIGQLGR